MLWHHVGAHLVQLNYVASVLGVAAHGTGPIALVKASANIFGCELEVAVPADGENLRWPHGERMIAVPAEVFPARVGAGGRTAMLDRTRWCSGAATRLEKRQDEAVDGAGSQSDDEKSWGRGRPAPNVIPAPMETLAG